MTHFWSKSRYQGEEAFSRRYVFLFTQDKSFPPQHGSLKEGIKLQNWKSPGNIGQSICLNYWGNLTSARGKTLKLCITLMFPMESAHDFKLKMAGDYRLVPKLCYPWGIDHNITSNSKLFIWRRWGNKKASAELLAILGLSIIWWEYVFDSVLVVHVCARACA